MTKQGIYALFSKKFFSKTFVPSVRQQLPAMLLFFL